MRYENNTQRTSSHPSSHPAAALLRGANVRRPGIAAANLHAGFRRAIDSTENAEYGDAPMRYRGLPLLVLLAAAVLLVGCGNKKPKYPACGKDKDCKEGEYCINKRCLECGDKSHCGEGEECVNGRCVAEKPKAVEDTDPRKKCKTDEDCADDEDCIDGRCSRPWEADAPKGVTCDLETIYFGFDEFTIPEDARDGLAATANCIRKAPEDRGLYITGYTDPRGTEEYNIALSERRARAVADFLARLGIDPARFRVIPKGETEATGVDEASYQQDRRVEIEWR